MNKIRYQTNVDFADGGYRSFQMSADNVLTVLLTSWQEKEIKIDFFNAIRFPFSLGDVISDFLEVKDSSFLYEAVDQYYVKRPSNIPFKHYQIVDVGDFPFIEVVAENVQVFEGDT